MEKLIKTYFLKIKELAGKYSHVNWALADHVRCWSQGLRQKFFKQEVLNESVIWKA